MPKETIDYSNTIIYKIYCKNDFINDMYVGHTTNFQQRKYAHKIACNNIKNNLKIYNIIRNNGGWDNWNMIEIARYNCKNSTEARIKEQEHYSSLNASLNSCPPYVDKINYFCNICNLQCNDKSTYKKHINCKLHYKKESTESTEKSQKNPLFYNCKICDYHTINKKDYSKHISTQKHVRAQSATFSNQSATNKSPHHICCNCNKSYRDKSGLWRHRKTCFIPLYDDTQNDNNIDNTKINESDDISTKELILMIFKQNTELQQALIEATKQNNMTNNHNNNANNTTNTNSHNQTNNSFNLQFFLNETCKNAMNMTDFIESIKLQLSDLISVGELGYIEGISNIIVKNLNALDVTERPVHCTDKKRETFYIKDENKWEKDEDDKKQMRKVIKNVAYKNERLLPEFKKKYPDYNDSDSIHSDQYSKIVVESYGVVGDNTSEKEDKIIRNISKATTIDKYSKTS